MNHSIMSSLAKPDTSRLKQEDFTSPLYLQTDRESEVIITETDSN